MTVGVKALSTYLPRSPYVYKPPFLGQRGMKELFSPPCVKITSEQSGAGLALPPNVNASFSKGQPSPNCCSAALSACENMA